MEVLDARGLMCPLPVLRLAKVLRGLDVGTQLTIWADDPVAVIDIPHFCAESGHALLSQREENGFQIYIIERK
ncbi:sulfurtransferase TusA family protein [Octadecabacter sp. CECT 8868]|nr:sulfurtransferase TusA family protein [Octadecabacter algicola]MCF2903689.1 sulfurtransferase TusA family protein [Octadecabacter algicola]